MSINHFIIAISQCQIYHEANLYHEFCVVIILMIWKVNKGWTSSNYWAITMEITNGRIEHGREIVQTRGYNKSKADWEKLTQEVRKHSVEMPEPINSRKDLIFIHSQKL